MQLTSHDLDELERHFCATSLAQFIERAWEIVEPGNPYIHNWHVDAICEHLTAVTDGQITRLLINIPPGTMKSLIAGVFWPAWEWGPKRMQHLRYVAASHAQDLAIRDTLKMRRLVSSEWYQNLWPTPLTKDQNEKTKFENRTTGFRQASAMKSLTGVRGHRVILDDPHSVEGALSDADRATAIREFKETVPSRLVEPISSAIVVVMQRVHEGDVSGVILSEELGYEHLMLPMEFEPNRRCTTSIGFADPRTQEGELLFPQRFPRDVVERDKKVMGSHAVAGQLQQRPSPRDGSVFKVEGLTYYLKSELPLKFDKIIQSWDCTFKDTDGTDYVVGQVWGKKGPNIYLLDQVRDRMSFTNTVKNIVALRNKWPGITATLIEDKANGPAVIDTLKPKIPGLKAIEPDGSKLARAHAITAYWESNNILVPHKDQCPWVTDFRDELLGFPSTVHDDQVDALTQAARYLYPVHGRIKINPDLLKRA